MNKKVLSFILVLALCSALLAGCTSASATTQEPGETVVTAPLQDATRQPATPLPTEPAATAVTPVPCEVCSDYDCNDGIYCDDWDEKQENLREQENIRNNTPCEVCGEYDCDDGPYCDDWDEKWETHHSTTPCEVCGEYDCDDGPYCDDWDDRYEHHHHGCK